MIAALVAVAALAAPAGFHEVKALEPAASYVAKKQVVVACPNSPSVWQAYTNGQTQGGSTYVGDDMIRLSYGVCSELVGKPDLRSPAYAGSVVILTHEAIHARGTQDEGVTECAAMHETPGVAVRFFRIKAGKQLRALMASAWVAHRKAPALYQTIC